MRDGYLIDYISGAEVKATPEEIQAVQPFVKMLTEDYGYPKELIVTHPQYRVKVRPSDTKKEYPVDIAVFSAAQKSDDDIYIVVECKKKARKDGRSQLEDYLRFCKAQLGVWYNGEERFFLRKYEEDGQVKFEEIPNIPKYGQRLEDIGKFNGLNDSFDSLTSRARRLGFQLDMPRGVMAICFSNFRGLGLEKNPVKLLYEQYNDPISEELDYLSTHGRLIELIREVFSDPQTIIASAARDKLSVIYAETARETDRTYAVSQDAIDRAWEIYEKLKEVSIETKIGLSPVGLNIYEIPASYKNAWEVVEIADRTGSPPGVYSFDQLLFEEITFNINRHYSMQFIEKKLLRLFADDANELAVTFKVYCESSFRKQAAAEALHLHRNTLAYRLRRIENLLGISMDDFKIVSAYYLTLCRMELYGMK